MKKSLFILPLLAAGMIGCSSEEPVQDQVNTSKETSYISIRLANSVGTRADGALDVEGDEYYEDGDQTENAVNVIRFYFFESNGDPAIVYTDGEGNEFNYVTVNSGFGQGTNDESPNVEKVLTATAAIETDGENFPAQIVAVLNPKNIPTTNTKPSLSQLYEIAADFSSTENGFMMSNSVYANEAVPATTVQATPVLSSNYYTTPEAALANPVTIYVERILAKVTMDVSLENTYTNGDETYYIPNNEETGKEYKDATGNQIYVKFLGWNTTATTGTSYMMKNINPGWAPNLFGATDGIYEPWNFPSYKRSFWAINPDPAPSFNYFNFGLNAEGGEMENNESSAVGVKGFDSGVTGVINYAYLQENAADGGQDNFTAGAGASHPSQVIVAAQLVNSTGAPITLIEWAFRKYSSEDDAVTAMLANIAPKNFWKKTSDNSYAQLSADDVVFVTAGSLNDELMDWQAKGRYYVYLQLTSTAAQDEWVIKGGTEAEPTYTPVPTEGEDPTSTGVNDALFKLGHAKYWNNGYTYYFFDIRHLGASENDPGYYGVVRNHVYKADVETLIGLGTPVYNPGEVIYPEKPEDEETYIAAAIKILSWRIVNNSVSFVW